MTRPLYGGNLAPRDDGGRYSVVHLCDGGPIANNWTHADAMDIAGMENGLQSSEAARYCAAGEQCLGFMVWRGAR